MTPRPEVVMVQCIFSRKPVGRITVEKLRKEIQPVWWQIGEDLREGGFRPIRERGVVVGEGSELWPGLGAWCRELTEDLE